MVIVGKLFGKTWLFDTLVEIAGSILTGVAIYNFALPAKFPMTGFSGLALILYRLFDLPIGVMTIVLNIPVAILCYRVLGRRFFLCSVRCMILSSLFVDYIAPMLPQYTGERLVAAICAGVLGGLGYALIYMRNSSTGGADFITMALKAKHPHLPLGRFIMLTDGIVVVLGGIIFRDFDGIVYGVFVSLGFAGVENVLYVLNAGFGTAVVRAIFSIPGHAMFGVVMGFYLSRAKWAEKYGQRHRMRADLRRSFFVPAVLHGLYDFLLMGFETVFYFYFAGLVIGVIRLLRKSAREDGPI